MRKHLSRSSFCLLIAALISGCAAGKKFDYHSVVADVTASGSTSIGIGTQDVRPSTTSTDKGVTFVGIARGGFGEPFDVRTQSGQPLAKDMSQSLKVSLSKKGFNATVIDLSSQDDNETVIKKLRSSNSDRLLFLKLNEWRSDTYSNTALTYNVDLEVMNANGEKIAAKHLEGKDNLRGRLMNPWGYAKQAVSAAFKKKMEELINDPDIQNALK
jgi:hypothetical protein